MPENNNHATLKEKQKEKEELIGTIEATFRKRWSPAEKFAEKVTNKAGTVRFLLLNVFFFAAWLVINSGWIPLIKPFDPYPFNFLVTAVSLEAIVLAIFVLITQNRMMKVASLREEVDLKVDTISEQEITKILRLLAIILEKLGIDPKKDPILMKMLKPTNLEEIRKTLEEGVTPNLRKEQGQESA